MTGAAPTFGIGAARAGNTVLKKELPAKNGGGGRQAWVPFGKKAAKCPGGRVEAVKGLARRFLPAGAGPASVAPGSGGVVKLDGRTMGVWREEDGRLCVVDIRCPHMGCRLEWNPHECSWDCPCHGSRFDRYAPLLVGPAQKEVRHD